MDTNNLKCLSDDQLVALPDLIKTERERRSFERTSQIPKKIIQKLQNQLKEISKLIESPDFRSFTVTIPACVNYIIDADHVSACVSSTDTRDLDFEEDEITIQLSISVKIKVARIQKKWDMIVAEAKELSYIYKVSTGEIWEMIDPKGEF